MSDLNTMATGGDRSNPDKSSETQDAAQAGQKRKDHDADVYQGANPPKKAKSDIDGPGIDDRQYDSALSDQELHGQVAGLKNKLRAQKGINTKLGGEIATLNTKINKKHRDLVTAKTKHVQMEAYYQKLLATKSRPDARTTIMSVDHRQVISRVKKTFDGIRQFAQRWAAADGTLDSNLSSEQKDILVSIITGASNLMSSNTMCRAEVAENVLNHERANRTILEACLNHWVCDEILMRPFGFLSLMADLPDNIDETVERLYTITFNTSEMRATTWRSVFAVCFDTAEVPISDDNTQTTKDILNARSTWSSSLAEKFLLSPITCLLRKISGTERRRMTKQLVRLCSDFGYLATYLCSQGNHTKLRTWTDIGQITFETSSLNMELHATMKMYRGEVYDESSFQGRPFEFLVCPQIELYGRDGYHFDEGRTILKSCHWFVQSSDHIKQDSPRPVEGDSSDNPVDLSGVAESKTPEKAKIPVIRVDDADTKSSDQLPSDEDTDSIRPPMEGASETLENRLTPRGHNDANSDQTPPTQDARGAEDTFEGWNFEQNCEGFHKIERTGSESASGEAIESQEKTQTVANQSTQASTAD